MLNYRALVIFPSRTKLFTCTEEHGDNVVEFNLIEEEWKQERIYGQNSDKLIQLAFSQDHKHIVATFMFGYKVSYIACTNNSPHTQDVG